MSNRTYRPANQASAPDLPYSRGGTGFYNPGVGDNFKTEPIGSASHETGHLIANARIYDPDAGNRDRGNCNVEAYIVIDHIIDRPVHALTVSASFLAQSQCGWFGGATDEFGPSRASIHAMQVVFAEIQPSGAPGFTRIQSPVLAYTTVGTPANTTIIQAESLPRLAQRVFGWTFGGLSLNQGQVTIRVGIWSGHHAEILDDVSMDATVVGNVSVYNVEVRES